MWQRPAARIRTSTSFGCSSAATIVSILDTAEQKGTGKWTAQDALVGSRYKPVDQVDLGLAIRGDQTDVRPGLQAGELRKVVGVVGQGTLLGGL